MPDEYPPANPEGSAGRASIAARLNRLPIGRVHKIAVVFVGLGLFFDTYEIFLAGTLSAVLKTQFGLSPDTLKAVLASAFIGQFLGAIFFGRLADKLGRRQAFVLNLAIYSVFSLVGGLSPNATILVIARFIAGLGLGAELALADAYLSDILPPKLRGRFLSWAYTTAFLGIPAAGFLARWLVPLKPLGVSGWRWMFFIGALGALLVWVLRRALPESPRWLESVGRTEEADRIVTSWEEDARRSGAELPPPEPGVATVTQDRLPVRILFTREYARRTFMQWTINGLEVFGYYGFGTLAPLVLLAKGYSVVSSLTFLAFVYIGYPIGSALSLPIIERMERKVLIAAGAAGMAITGLLFGYAPSPFWIVLWGFLFTVISNTFSNAFHVYLGEIYPTAVRATAAGAAYSISRLVTAALPYILIPVLDHSGGSAVFTVVAIALGLLIIDVLALGPRATGLSVEIADRPEVVEPLEPRPSQPAG
ncbi:MFS transporter [Actinoallomurus acaciae]|uniref:MFS transporter n=1 Tax=Actinoallomurus acaciae TaxID=502577 RepID=A0ABV5YMT3_9ACTN